MTYEKELYSCLPYCVIIIISFMIQLDMQWAFCLSLPAMDPIPSSLPVSDSSDSDVESGGEPPSSEGLASSSESRFVYTTILE